MNAVPRYALVLLALLVACTPTAGPDTAQVIGTIEGFTSSDPIWSVSAAGRSITVTVTTYGDGCSAKGDLHLGVRQVERVIEATPYDQRQVGLPCEAILKTFEHSRSITVGQSGEWTVILRGVDADGSQVEYQQTVAVD